MASKAQLQEGAKRKREQAAKARRLAGTLTTDADRRDLEEAANLFAREAEQFEQDAAKLPDES
jgi:hypothetical protein